MTAIEAVEAMRLGVEKALPGTPHACIKVPLADGGEGTVDALIQATAGTVCPGRVQGPAGGVVSAHWGRLPDGTAVIEMAQASGLTLVQPERRDTTTATSFGTGQLIGHALDHGCRRLLIGIGGSATTDGGSGALQALGVRFLDARGEELQPGGAALCDLADIDTSGLDRRLAGATVQVLCDVTNPLCGPNGAAHVYGPQKGATPADVELLDEALSHFADITAAQIGRDPRDVAGAGAAGGMGFGLMAYLGATLRPGIEAVLEATRFAEIVAPAHLVLTGEGAIDSQTLSGKAIQGVTAAARTARNGSGIPVIAFGGAVRLSSEELQQLGVVTAIPLPNGPLTLNECLAQGPQLLTAAVERTIRLWRGV